MLREQIIGLAFKTLTRAYETKERIKNSLNSNAVQNYIRDIKNAAAFAIENQWQKFQKLGEQSRRYVDIVHERSPSSKTAGNRKKIRKSSIKAAKDIGSTRADIVLAKLRHEGARLVKEHDAIDGKPSLAYVIWALGHAYRAQLIEGISVHDVSALIYRACGIQLYPINISRVVYGNTALVKQVGQQKRTKTYLLTDEGETLFTKKFL